MIKLGLSLDEDGAGDDADLPPLEEGAAAGGEDASRMEEVD